jgi:amino acid adenylation domain-containing protein
MFESQTASTPGRPAAVSAGRTVSYGELNAQSNRLARVLRARGVGPDVLVGLLVERSIETLVSLLAILKAGGAYVPLDPGYPADRVAWILDDARASLLIADPVSTHVQHRLGQPVLVLGSPEAVAAGESVEDLPPVNAESDLAYVIYTSGSTGRPKGVQIAHKGLVNFLRSMRHVPGLGPDDVVAAVTTVSFDIAALELLLPLTTGARTVIVARDTAADGRRLAEVLQQQGVTLMQATPATWRLLLEAGWEGAPGLTVLCGGEAMPRELADRLLPRCAALWNMYGPTETTVWSTVHRVRPGTGPVPLGAPIANTTVHILDAQLRPVRSGDEGELCIGGDGVARGYLGRPDLTAERFVPDPFAAVPGGRLYRTGDLARRLPDGALLFGGRRDHQVKIRGFRVELGEVEEALLRDADVREAAVLAREDGRGEKRLVAFVAWRGARGGDAHAVRERLRSALPAYMIPSWLVALDALPQTPNGKVDRVALAALPPRERPEAAAPRDQIERRLVRLWERVLELPSIGADADFFELGGDSLHAAALVAGISREFHCDLPAAVLVEAPTIRQLADRLRERPPAGRWTSLVPFRAGGTKRPFFFVHGGAGTVLFMRELVAGIDGDRPVYGLQSEGQDGGPVVHASVEQMAALYLEEMRAVQPHGPYLLGGYCFGGVVAFEIARRLRGEGEEVGFVGLVNAPCPVVEPRTIVSQEAAQPNRRAWLRDGLAWRWDLVRAMVRRTRLAPLGARIALTLGGRVPKSWRPSYILSVTERAERLYRPRPYDGRIAVIRGNGLYTDPELGWRGLASDIDTRAIGRRQRLRRELIASPLVRELAEDLRARLDLADAGAVASNRDVPRRPL